MASSRRRGTENSETRAELIEAAETLIREEGAGALTSRTLADKLNLSRQIVHYYFKSIDDLFIAVVKHRAAKSLARLERAIETDEPLRSIWQLCNDPVQSVFAVEICALANRRAAVRAVVKEEAEKFREAQHRALVRHLEKRGLKPSIHPLVATVLLSSLPQTLALESGIDIELGHKETLAFVDDCLRAFAEGRETPMQYPGGDKPAPDKPAAKKKPAPRSSVKPR